MSHSLLNTSTENDIFTMMDFSCASGTSLHQETHFDDNNSVLPTPTTPIQHAFFIHQHFKIPMIFKTTKTKARSHHKENGVFVLPCKHPHKMLKSPVQFKKSLSQAWGATKVRFDPHMFVFQDTLNTEKPGCQGTQEGQGPPKLAKTVMATSNTQLCTWTLNNQRKLLFSCFPVIS